MANWKAAIPRPITLRGPASGTIASLADAGEFLLTNYQGVTQSEGLTRTMALLMKAAETGDADDIEAATEQLEGFLMAQRLR